MRVFLPPYLSARTIYSVVGQVLDDALTPRSDRVRFDFRALLGAEPSGIAALAGLIDGLRREHGVRCAVQAGSCAPLDPACRLLWMTRFFPRCLQHPVSLHMAPDPAWLPVTRVGQRQWPTWVDEVLTGWLAERLGQPAVAIRWRIAAIGSLLSHIPEAGDAVIVGRHDRERGRMAIALALPAASAAPPSPHPLADLFRITECWTAFHAGWQIETSVPHASGQLLHAVPAPVPYPGLLVDLVLGTRSLSVNPSLNEPRVAAFSVQDAPVL